MKMQRRNEIYRGTPERAICQGATKGAATSQGNFGDLGNYTKGARFYLIGIEFVAGRASS